MTAPVLIAIVGAIVAIAIGIMARDGFVRMLADRADARVKRSAEAEIKAEWAATKVSELEKKLREVEKLVGAQMARAVRR